MNKIKRILCIVFMLVIVLLVMFKVFFKIKLYFFEPLKKYKSRSLFFDFYITILPFTLLGLLTLKNYQNGMLLVLSIILFNVPTLYNMIKFFKLK